MEVKVVEIVLEVFDCDYFKGDLLFKFVNVKDDWDFVNYIWQKLIK